MHIDQRLREYNKEYFYNNKINIKGKWNNWLYFSKINAWITKIAKKTQAALIT